MQGYVRTHDPALPFTTIAFTRDAPLLDAIGCAAYSEDQLEQQVALINEEKVVRAIAPVESGLVRPMTGYLL
jgi:hypothetical protein